MNDFRRDEVFIQQCLAEPDPYAIDGATAVNIGGHASLGTARVPDVTRETHWSTPSRTELRNGDGPTGDVLLTSVTVERGGAAAVYEDERVLQLLAESEDAWADGASLYGPGGLFDAQRKALVSVVMLRIRDELIGKGEKPTEKVLDAMAHADPTYTEFLGGHVTKRAGWLSLDSERARHWAALKALQARGWDARRAGA